GTARAGGVRDETRVRPRRAGTGRTGARAAGRGRTALRRLDHAQARTGRLHRTTGRVPVSAQQGQFHRGRHVGGTAQHHRRARARPARRTPHRHRRRLEGPAPMTTADLLYSDVETDLRASVRDLLGDRCSPESLLARVESDEPYDMDLWRTLARDLGTAGLAVPEELGGQGAS